MKFLLIYPYYIAWHYTAGVKDLFNIWKNFMLFMWSFFSIGTLFLTLFKPFQRLEEHYKGGLDLEDFFSVMIINIIMRLIGFFVRTFVILLGLCAFVLTFISGIIAFIIWLLIPILMVFILIVAVRALFNFSS